MLQIGDIVRLKPFGETLYTITGIMRAPGYTCELAQDPENVDRVIYQRPNIDIYAVNGGEHSWVKEDIIPTGDHDPYPPSRYAIGDEVTIGRDSDIRHHIIAITHARDEYTYTLAPTSGNQALIKRKERDLIPATQYSLF